MCHFSFFMFVRESSAAVVSISSDRRLRNFDSAMKGRRLKISKANVEESLSENTAGLFKHKPRIRLKIDRISVIFTRLITKKNTKKHCTGLDCVVYQWR